MRYERFVIDGGDGTHYALDFHPRLTVVTGLGRVEREVLMSELVGVLSSSRDGGHLEVTDDQGRHLAIFRPYGGRHLVVDIDTGTDVSTRYRTAEGNLDLLAVEGLDRQSAKARMRVSASDLSTSTQSAELIRRLSACDQGILWKVAERLQSTEGDLNRMASESGTNPEDLELIDAVERRHAEVEAALTSHEKARRLTFLLAVVCTAAMLPLAVYVSPLLGAIAAVPALGMTLLSFLVWRRLEQARSAESDALQRAGAASYLGFHLQRVNTLLSSDQSRRKLMDAAESHREAAAAWQKLAGDVPVSWAVSHRDDVVSAARVRGRAEAPTEAVPSDDPSSAVAEELLVRLGGARRLGRSGESFPLVLDDPFVGFSSGTKPALLELIGESSHRQQIIFLTEDPDVAAWARLEAITGALSVIEPAQTETEVAEAAALEAPAQPGIETGRDQSRLVI